MTADSGNWITSQEAAEILTKNSGHPVARQYVRKLANRGEIAQKQLDGRTYLYNRRHVEEYRVRTTPGRRPHQSASVSDE
jgi:hypothetical protein